MPSLHFHESKHLEGVGVWQKFSAEHPAGFSTVDCAPPDPDSKRPPHNPCKSQGLGNNVFLLVRESGDRPRIPPARPSISGLGRHLQQKQLRPSEFVPQTRNAKAKAFLTLWEDVMRFNFLALVSSFFLSGLL